MAEIWTMGEAIVEIMREHEGASLGKAERFVGPFPSGAPAIFIDTAARLGHSAAIIGGIGKDEFGDCLYDRLAGDGVDCTYLKRDEENFTGCAFVTYFEDGSRKFIFHIGNTAAVKAKAPNARCFEGSKYFHIMGCSLMADKNFAGEIISAMKSAVRAGAKVSFDPNIRPELLKDSDCGAIISEVLASTSIFMPGVSELLQITGKALVDEAISDCFENERMELIVLKNGSKGCTVYTRTKDGFSSEHFGIYPVDVLDPTGAGDSFDAAFICGLCDGMPLADCAKQGSAAAALNTAAFGPMEGKISVGNVREIVVMRELV